MLSEVQAGLNTVDLAMFRTIGLSWLSTIPCSALLSAALYYVLRLVLIGPF